MYVMYAQVSIRKGEKVRNLTDRSFKICVVWSVVTRSAPNQLWTVQLRDSHKAVKAYVCRDKSGYPAHVQRYLDPGNIFDCFVVEWNASRLVDDPAMPRVPGGPAGAAYPPGDMQYDIWHYVRGESHIATASNDRM